MELVELSLGDISEALFLLLSLATERMLSMAKRHWNFILKRQCIEQIDKTMIS